MSTYLPLASRPLPSSSLELYRPGRNGPASKPGTYNGLHPAIPFLKAAGCKLRPHRSACVISCQLTVLHSKDRAQE
eukprot:15893-Eustigmatos_ZCMA.PRE.1